MLVLKSNYIVRPLLVADNYPFLVLTLKGYLTLLGLEGMSVT